MYVFVYGTLTDPTQVDAVLDGTQTPSNLPADAEVEWEFVGEATLHGLHRVDARYPTLAPGGSTTGRVLRVDGDSDGDSDADSNGGPVGDAHGTSVSTSDSGPVQVVAAESTGRRSPGIEALDAYEGVDRGLYVRAAVPRAGDAGTEPPDAPSVSDDEPVWVYVGDPRKLEPAEPIDWGHSGAFPDQVRSYLERSDVSVVFE